MKKYFFLLAALLLVGIFRLPVSAAAETCPACGEAATWEAMPAKVPSVAGHYHYALEGDQANSQWILPSGVTVCVDLKGHTLRSNGRMFNLSSGSELNILDSVGTGHAIATTGSNNVTGGVITVAGNAVCNLYGGTLQLETKYVSGKGVGTGGIVYLNGTDATFNVYGGTVQGAALVKSEYTLTWNGYGAAVYLGGASRLNVYGGQLLRGSVPEGGKGECVYVQSTSAIVTVSGDSKLEEVYFASDKDHFVVEGCYTGSATLAYNDSLNIIEGSVLGVCEDANIARATILCRDWILIGSNGKLIAAPDSEAAVCGETTAYFSTVQEAVSAADGGYVKLLKNNLDFTYDKDLTVDLNGQNAAASGSGTLTVFDSQTDDYTVADGIYGQLSGNSAAAEGYVAVLEEGKLSFHRADLEIYAMTLRPGVAGVYYQSRILCDEKAARQVESFGVALNVFEAPNAENMATTTKASSFSNLSAGETFASGTLLKGIVKAKNTEARNLTNSLMPIYGSAYLRTVDGNYIFSTPVTRTLQQQVEAADTLWQELDAAQQTALVALYDRCITICKTWEIPNIRMAHTKDTLKITTGWECSHAPGNTVSPSEDITYSLTLTNNGSEAKTLQLENPIPENTVYVSGGDKLDGDILCWNVTVAAGETKKLPFTVRVKDDLSLCNGGSVQCGDSVLFIEYTLNKIDGQYFVDALKALSDSTYSGMDLADRLYVHGYTQNALTNNSITDTALEDILSGENAVLLDMVAPGLFGGSQMPETIGGIKGNAGAVTEKALINGDILLVDGKVYAYGDGLWSLEAGAKRVDTSAVLAALPQAEKYAVLRPSVALADRLTPTDPDAPLDALNDYQKALIATAEAYLLRGEKLQYSDTRFTAQGSTIGTEFRWQSKVNAPEDCTAIQWGYTNCAAFTYEVYYQALGFALPDNMYTTVKLTNSCAANGTQVYHYHREADSVQTEEEKAQVEQEFMSRLQPGDILVVLRNGSSGHAMLYVGNGNIIHSSGGVYQYTASVGTEVYEASIRRMKVKDYFFNPNSAKGYVFGIVTDLSIVRPLQIFDGAIPENTQNRVANMQGIMAQKLSSHAKSQTVNPGDEMTFTYEVYNTRDTAVTLEILEQLPANTTYLSGAETVNGDKLSWSVTVPAEGRVRVSYKLKVNEGTAYGTVIQSTDSTVGGITVKCAPVQVKRTFTASEQTAMIEKVKQLRADGTNTLTGLALANEIYKAATGETLFASTDIEAVTEGEDGIFAKKQMSANRQIFKVNTGSQYQQLVAPTLYGGYRMFTPLWQHDRARLPQEHDLQVGDLLIGRTLSGRSMYMYLGEELGFVKLTASTLDADTVTPAQRLERLHGYGYYFAILRPSFALEK